MIAIIKLIIWVVATAGVKVYLDRKGRKPNYLLQNCVLGAMAIVHAVWVLPHPYGENVNWYALGWWKPIVPYSPVFLFQVTSFWIFFELGDNYVKGRRKFQWDGLGLLYYDHKERDSGFVDRFFAYVYKRTGHHNWHTLAKVVAFWFMTCSAIVLYYNA